MSPQLVPHIMFINTGRQDGISTNVAASSHCALNWKIELQLRVKWKYVFDISLDICVFNLMGTTKGIWHLPVTRLTMNTPPLWWLFCVVKSRDVSCDFNVSRLMAVGNPNFEKPISTKIKRLHAIFTSHEIRFCLNNGISLLCCLWKNIPNILKIENLSL